MNLIDCNLLLHRRRQQVKSSKRCNIELVEVSQDSVYDNINVSDGLHLASSDKGGIYTQYHQNKLIICMTCLSPCIMSVQYTEGVQYNGGCSVHWVMSTMRFLSTVSTLGSVQYSNTRGIS